MTNKEIKSKFKNHNVQVSKDVMPLIHYHLNSVVDAMADRCKRGNIKRLTDSLFYIAVGDINRNKY